jgi:F0F1-type ATP synthase membrane subunit b/b'
MTHETSLMDAILHSNLLNFLLVLALLVWVFKRFNIAGQVEANKEKLRQELALVTEQREAALAQLEAVKRKQENLSREVDVMLALARSTADTLSAQTLARAEAEAAKLIESTKKRLLQEEAAAAEAIQARLLSEAVGDVRDTLTDGLTEEDRQRSVEAFLNELPKLKQLT